MYWKKAEQVNGKIEWYIAACAYLLILRPDGLVVSASYAVGCGFAPRPGHTKDHNNKSANALALCHPPSASFCSVLAVQWSSRIFTQDI